MRVPVRKERAPSIAAVVWYFLAKLSLSTEGTQVTRKQMAVAALIFPCLWLRTQTGPVSLFAQPSSNLQHPTGYCELLGPYKQVFFSPPSIPLPFPLKAIMQTMARKNEWPLDRMCLTIDVTKKTKEDYGHPPREGAYLHGLHLEGTTPKECTWNWLSNKLVPVLPISPEMIILCWLYFFLLPSTVKTLCYYHLITKDNLHYMIRKS